MPHSALGWLDLIVPKDRGSRRLARAVRFGPDPKHLLDLYAPRGDGPWPVLLFIHGGGWDSGGREEYGFAGRALAALGFLVAVADYRLFPDVRFPAFLDDLGQAADWLVGHAADYGGDAAQVVLAGHSAGAYNAVMLALAPERFGAAALAGRIAAVVGLSGPYDFYPFDVKPSIDSFGDWPEPETTQPVNLVTAGSPPMLLVHGGRDRTVGLYNSANLAARLNEAGVLVVKRYFAGLGHPQTVLALMRPLRRIWPVHAAIAVFLADRINQSERKAPPAGGVCRELS